MSHRQYNITGFKHVKQPDNQKVLKYTWLQLERFLFFPRSPLTQKNDQVAWSPSLFSGRRLNENSTELSLLVADIDHKLTYTEVEDFLRRNRIQSLMYTSFSHRIKTKQNPRAEDRFRVVFPLNKPVPRRFWKYYHKALVKWFEDTFEVTIDSSTSDPARAYFVGYATEHFETSSIDGEHPGLMWDTLSHEQYKRFQREAEEKRKLAQERREKFEAHRKHMEKEHPSFRDLRKYSYEMLRTQSDYRLTLAHKLGATISGGKATGFPCPSCHRSDVTFFYIDPNFNSSSGFCGHKNSCGDGDYQTFSLGYLAEINGLL